MNNAEQIDYMRVNIYRAVFVLMIILIVGAFLVGLYAFIVESPNSCFWEYSSFEISDWLINYSGGFVRRGLIGQLLYLVYQIHPYPVRYAILMLYVIGFLLVSWMLVRLLKKRGLSVFILPFTICLYYSFTCDLIWTRRDYWSLLIAFAIYYQYFKFISKSDVISLIFFYVLSAVALLIHEASIFYTHLILLLHSVFLTYKNYEVRNLLRLSLLWLPVLILFIFIIINKGSENVMASIWESWQPCFQTYPPKSGIIPDVGNGVEFLRRSSYNAIAMHVNLVWLSNFAPYIPSWPFNIYIIVCTYYLVTRINTIDMKFYKLGYVNKVLLSNIVILQFILLIPMFGFLSCDLGRVVPYWVISSLFIYCVTVEDSNSSLVSIPFVSKISAFMQNKIDGMDFLNKSWLYCLIILTLPLNCYYGATYMGIVPVQYFLKVIKFLYA